MAHPANTVNTATAPPKPAPMPAVDALSDVLDSVRLTGALFFVAEASHAWCGAMPKGEDLAPILLPRAQSVISYHIVLGGSCWGTLPDASPVWLDSGDIVVFPRGDPYAISVRRGSLDLDPGPTLTQMREMSAGEAPFVISDGGPTALRMVCGFLGCDMYPYNPLMAALPRLLIVRRARTTPDQLDALVDLTLAQARASGLGSECVRLRLSELLFVEVVRRYLCALPSEETGWLSALRDPVAGRALALLHGCPTGHWTLAGLAKQVGTSRSVLAERFTRIVGKSPMQYLAHWRMHLAAGLLVEGHAKVSTVAGQVGYDSEAAFSRAFKKLTGASPASWRHAHLAYGAGKSGAIDGPPH